MKGTKREYTPFLEEGAGNFQALFTAVANDKMFGTRSILPCHFLNAFNAFDSLFEIGLKFGMKSGRDKHELSFRCF